MQHISQVGVFAHYFLPLISLEQLVNLNCLPFYLRLGKTQTEDSSRIFRPTSPHNQGFCIDIPDLNTERSYCSQFFAIIFRHSLNPPSPLPLFEELPLLQAWRWRCVYGNQPGDRLQQVVLLIYSPQDDKASLFRKYSLKKYAKQFPAKKDIELWHCRSDVCEWFPVRGWKQTR